MDVDTLKKQLKGLFMNGTNKYNKIIKTELIFLFLSEEETEEYIKVKTQKMIIFGKK